MAVTTTLSSTTKSFIEQLAKDYPGFSIERGKQEHWSPRTNAITFNPNALLGHTSYQSDFELLKMESEAWHLAAKIGLKYGVSISEDHIQNCLDTYRDWLHRRSQCPTCGLHVIQETNSNYKCFNCGSAWNVSSGRFVRPYRRLRR